MRDEAPLEPLPYVCRFCQYEYVSEQGRTSHLVDYHYRVDPDVYGALLKAERERDALAAERAAIIERIDGLNDGESLPDAVGFVVAEWEHFGRELHRAVDETIPTLTAERNAARQSLAAAERREQALLEAGENLHEELFDVAFGWDLGLPTRCQDSARGVLNAWRILAAAPAPAEPVDGGA